MPTKGRATPKVPPSEDPAYPDLGFSLKHLEWVNTGYDGHAFNKIKYKDT
jgi:hypothetical protein